MADEDEKDEESNTKAELSYGELDTAQRKELDELLATFTDVITPITGRVSILKHIINTGDSLPLRTAPYWLAVNWKEQLQTGGESTGRRRDHPSISKSLVFSNLLPVRKKDGSVRLCVDFRRINKVTVPNPYLKCLG